MYIIVPLFLHFDTVLYVRGTIYPPMCRLYLFLLVFLDLLEAFLCLLFLLCLEQRGLQRLSSCRFGDLTGPLFFLNKTRISACNGESLDEKLKNLLLLCVSNLCRVLSMALMACVWGGWGGRGGG